MERGAEVPSLIEFNKSTLMMTYRNSPMVTTFTCRSKTLRLLNSTVMQMANCKEILKVFVNKVSSEIFCVVEFYKKEGRVAVMNTSANLLEDIADYMLTPVFIDLCTSYLSPASKT